MARPDRRPDERGFTLIELMIVVAIVAILAAVVVPSFMGESRKTKASSEVNPMFVELQTKQEQYKLESTGGVYLDVPACPSSPSPKPQSIAACTASASWTTLRIVPPESGLRCSYKMVTGLAGVDPTPSFPAGFTSPTTAPASNWYIVHATCDMDGKPAVYGEYLQSSLDQRMQVKNEGR